jgi:hypothetical protein
MKYSGLDKYRYVIRHMMRENRKKRRKKERLL